MSTMRQRADASRFATADASQARQLHALIAANREEGHLLPRTLAELDRHAGRFVVAMRGRQIVGCAELAPLSASRRRGAIARGRCRQSAAHGVGAMIVEELRRRARREGFEKLCAFTHDARLFIRMGFSIVPHVWLLEKITTDCVKCPLFRRCGQYAMVVPLDDAVERSRARRRTVRSPAHA